MLFLSQCNINYTLYGKTEKKLNIENYFLTVEALIGEQIPSLHPGSGMTPYSIAVISKWFLILCIGLDRR